jgi:hypothetical protein
MNDFLNDGRYSPRTIRMFNGTNLQYSVNQYPASMGASSRERQAMDAFLNRGYEVVKPDAD